MFTQTRPRRMRNSSSIKALVTMGNMREQKPSVLQRVPIVRCLYEPPWVLAKRAREEMERENAYLRQTAGPTPMLLDGRRYTGATAYLQGRTDVARQSLQPVVRTPGTATPQLEGEADHRPTTATSYELGAAVVREIRVTTPARSTRRPEDDKRALKQ